MYCKTVHNEFVPDTSILTRKIRPPQPHSGQGRVLNSQPEGDSSVLRHPVCFVDVSSGIHCNNAGMKKAAVGCVYSTDSK